MLLSPTSVEIDRIYSNIISNSVRSLTITSANAGEGVSTIALAIAQRNLLADRSTLIVDLNLYHPTFKEILNIRSSSDENLSACYGSTLVGYGDTSVVLTGVPAPSTRETALQFRQQNTLEKHIQSWLAEYDLVVIDTSPLNRINANNIPAERIAAACDGCLVVVMADLTTESMLTTAIEKLSTSRVNILGCVFNDKHNPSLKSELIREAQRIPAWLNRLKASIEKYVKQSAFLSQEL
jgi:Mrp family chromosome partitioning ATPase